LSIARDDADEVVEVDSGRPESPGLCGGFAEAERLDAQDKLREVKRLTYPSENPLAALIAPIPVTAA